MCRNIKTLAHFTPPATDEEIRASALQFVRKLSGTTKPSKANEAAFNRAVEEVTEAARTLVRSLVTTAPPRTREEEARKAKERARLRYGLAPVLVVSLLASGCASVALGQTERITVTSVPEGARVIVDGEHRGATPLVVAVPRRPRAVEISLQAAGHAEERLVLGRRASRAAASNVLLGLPTLFNQGIESRSKFYWALFGPIALGVGIDFLTGSAFEREAASVHVVLKPEPD